MWTPRPRCFPEHSRHMKMPYVTEAHCGFFWEQSTQVLLAGRDWRSRSRRAAAADEADIVARSPAMILGFDLEEKWEWPTMMFGDQELGFFANFLGIFIFLLVIAYHFVMADPKAVLPLSFSGKVKCIKPNWYRSFYSPQISVSQRDDCYLFKMAGLPFNK
ncbi:Dolichyl-diphosphooligosaccharide--protein glycosyltransferase subunit 4A-like protein [Drosera capensis]